MSVDDFKIVNGVLRKYTGKDTEVVIPDGVTEIGEYAFFRQQYLTRVTIPKGVTTIGELAFSECTSLRKVNLPDSITRIERYAFYGCLNLSKKKLARIYLFNEDAISANQVASFLESAPSKKASSASDCVHSGKVSERAKASQQKRARTAAQAFGVWLGSNIIIFGILEIASMTFFGVSSLNIGGLVGGLANLSPTVISIFIAVYWKKGDYDPNNFGLSNTWWFVALLSGVILAFIFVWVINLLSTQA